jgi:hypothetical protein
MKWRRFGWPMPRVVMLLVRDFDASFRRIFGGFLNVEGFCEVFYTEFEGFCPIYKTEKTSLERLGSLFAFFR